MRLVIRVKEKEENNSPMLQWYYGCQGYDSYSLSLFWMWTYYIWNIFLFNEFIDYPYPFFQIPYLSKKHLGVDEVDNEKIIMGIHPIPCKRTPKYLWAKSIVLMSHLSSIHPPFPFRIPSCTGCMHKRWNMALYTQIWSKELNCIYLYEIFAKSYSF